MGSRLLRIPAPRPEVGNGRDAEGVPGVSESFDPVLNRAGQMLVPADMQRIGLADLAEGGVAGGRRPAVRVHIRSRDVVRRIVAGLDQGQLGHAVVVGRTGRQGEEVRPERLGEDGLHPRPARPIRGPGL